MGKAPPILSASLRKPFNQVTARVLADLIRQGVPLNSSLRNPRSGARGILLEDCFPDLRTWITARLPLEEKKRRDILREKEAERDRLIRRQERRRRLASKWGIAFLGSSALVFILTTVIFYTVLRDHHGPQLGLVWGAVVVILALRSSIAIGRRDGRYGDVGAGALLGSAVLCANYLWVFGLFVACTPSSQDSRVETGFKIVSASLLFFGGIVVMWCTIYRDLV